MDVIMLFAVFSRMFLQPTVAVMESRLQTMQNRYAPELWSRKFIKILCPVNPLFVRGLSTNYNVSLCLNVAVQDGKYTPKLNTSGKAEVWKHFSVVYEKSVDGEDVAQNVCACNRCFRSY